MKKCFHRCFKPFLITIFSVFILFVLVLHLLPFFIDLNDYKSFVCTEFRKSSGMVLKYDDAKLLMFPFFRAHISVDDVEVLDNKKQEVFEAKNVQVDVPLIELLSNKIKISSVKVDSPNLHIVKNKSGKLKLEESIPKRNSRVVKPENNNLIVDLKGLNLKVNNYKIHYLDNSALVVLDVESSGKEFCVENFDPYGVVKFKADGVLSINNKKYFVYDSKSKINLALFVSEPRKNHIQKKGAKKTFVPKKRDINPLYQIYKNNIKATFKSDIDILALDNIQGEMMVDKLNLKVDSHQLPESRIYLRANKDKFYTDSKIYVNKGAYLQVCGDLNKDLLNLKMKSSLVKLSDVKSLASMILSSAGISSYELDKSRITGDTIANLTLKSNFKTMKSSGYFKINNAGISYRGLAPSISGFNADIKMRDNSIVFDAASGFVAGDKFDITGGIDPDTNLNLDINIPDLRVGHVFDGLKNSNISGGKYDKLNLMGDASVKVLLRGRLNKINPKTRIVLNNLSLKYQDFALPLKIENGKILVDNEKIAIEVPDFYLNNSKFTLAGNIPMSLNRFSIKANGDLKDKDVSKILNVESVGSGEASTFLNIWGSPRNINLSAQVLNTKDNFLFITNLGSNNLINAQMDFGLNTINLTNVSVNKTSNNTLMCDSSLNLKGAQKLAVIEGSIVEVDKRARFKNSQIKALKPIEIAIPVGEKANVNLEGQILLKGYLDKPEMEGNMTLSDMKIPDLKTKVNYIGLALKDGKLKIKAPEVKIGRSSLGAVANVDFRDFDPSYVNGLKIYSQYFDADEFFALLGNLNPNNKSKAVKVKPSQYSLKKHYVPNVSPIVIKKGEFEAETLIINKVKCNDFKSNIELDRYSLVSADKLSTIAMGGTVDGSASYDIPSSKLGLKIKADNVDVDEFVVKFLGLPPRQIKGRGFAQADISFKASSSEDIVRTMQGEAVFNVNNGEMGDLGRIDHYLSAANIISNNILSLNLNRVINGVSMKKTGEFKKAYGKLVFVRGGIMRVDHLKTEGPKLSIYIRGDVNNISSYGSLDVYGRLSQEIVKSLGALGELSVEKLLKKVPVLSELSKYHIGLLETSVPESHRKQIPELSEPSPSSQEFSAKIKGPIYKASSVKSFRWIKNPQETTSAPVQKKNAEPVAPPPLGRDAQKILETSQQIFSIFQD